jgi:phosphoheptose isomerase
MQAVLLAGWAGTRLRPTVSDRFCVPSRATSHIQEMHIKVSLAVGEMIEPESQDNA